MELLLLTTYALAHPMFHWYVRARLGPRQFCFVTVSGAPTSKSLVVLVMMRSARTANEVSPNKQEVCVHLSRCRKAKLGDKDVDGIAIHTTQYLRVKENHEQHHSTLNVIHVVTNGMFGLDDGSRRQLDDGVFLNQNATRYVRIYNT